MNTTKQVDFHSNYAALMLPTYIAHLGWLKGKCFNSVLLEHGAIKDTLDKLHGASLYARAEKKHKLGIVHVACGAVYVIMIDDKWPYLAKDERPALSIQSIVKIVNGKTVVQSVTSADLFLTKDDNGNTFESLNVL